MVSSHPIAKNCSRFIRAEPWKEPNPSDRRGPTCWVQTHLRKWTCSPPPWYGVVVHLSVAAKHLLHRENITFVQHDQCRNRVHNKPPLISKKVLDKFEMKPKSPSLYIEWLYISLIASPTCQVGTATAYSLNLL